jgi:acetylxylan esterase
VPFERNYTLLVGFEGALRSRRCAGLLSAALVLLCARFAQTASLQPVNDWGQSGVPTYINMFIYVPDKPAMNPPILVINHYCGGSAAGVFGQAQSGGLVAAANQYGFIMIVPQTTNPASSKNCWDVGSKQSLTHDGGGDTQAIAQMVEYTVATYAANAERVYVTGDSSGGMMTEALLAVYPDVFKAGAAFAGVPAGCWSAGWSASSNWGGTCASGKDIMTAAQWGDLVRGMYPAYTGHRPRVQLVQGDADQLISYENFGEGIKEWSDVLGLDVNAPTSTSTGLTLGTHQATREQWKNSCGYVVLDTLTSLGGDHGPSDALFSAGYVVPFLGLDTVGPVDPEIAACPDEGNGAGGTGPRTGAAAAVGDAGLATGSAGAGAATDGARGTTAAGNGAVQTGAVVPMDDGDGAAMAGAVGAEGTPMGSANASGKESGTGMNTSAVGSLSSAGAASSAGNSGCSLASDAAALRRSWDGVALFGLGLSVFARRRRGTREG